MTHNSFTRYEDKYLISQPQYNSLISLLKPYGHIDSYGLYPISSAYFDNTNFDFAKTSIRNPLNNQKIRLRKYSHESFSTNDPLMYELKARKNGKVLKYQTTVFLTSFPPLLRLTPAKNDSNFKSIQNIQLANHMNLQIIIKYLRIAYIFESYPDLRITFDTNICCLPFIESIEKHTKYSPHNLISSDQHLMEIKYDSVIPSWLSKILVHNDIKKCNFSKFVSAYTELF